jgi:hypothetical protein
VTIGGRWGGLFLARSGGRDVDDADQAAFDGTFGMVAGDPGYLAYFDFDGDGNVDQQDQDHFLLRLGTALSP